MKFKRSALKNPSFASTLNENFICTYKQVSSFRVESPRRNRHQIEQAKKDRSVYDHRIRKNGGNIVSYFCDSAGRVMEIFVGPGFAPEMDKAAKRAVKLNKTLVSAPASEHSELARAYVRDLIDEDAKKTFNDFVESHSGINSADESALREILAARDRFQENEFREHVLLTKYPLPKIEDIEKPVFECLTGNEYKVASPEYQDRLRQFADANNSGKFILAVMLDDKQFPRLRSNSTLKQKYVAPDINKITSSKAIQKRSDQFAIVGVTHDDLFRILSELEKEPMRFKKNPRTDKKGIGYIMFDRDVKAMKFLSTDTKLAHVSRLMRLAAK